VSPSQLSVGWGVTYHIKGTARELPKIPTFLPNCSLTEDEEDHPKEEKHWDNYNQSEDTIKALYFYDYPGLIAH